MIGEAIEEHAILHAQNIDLIYSKVGTLYNILANSPFPSTYPQRPKPGSHLLELLVHFPLTFWAI